MCLENILLPCWCRIYNTTHSEVTCQSCREAIHQAKMQLRLEESSKMYTIEKLWNAHLQPINLASKEEGITMTSCSEEGTIEHDNQSNSVKSKIAYLMPRKETPTEVDLLRKRWKMFKQIQVMIQQSSKKRKPSMNTHSCYKRISLKRNCKKLEASLEKKTNKWMY